MLSPTKQVLNSIGREEFKTSAAKAERMYYTRKSRVNRLPLFANSKSADIRQNFGFHEGKLDLNEYLINDPNKTFLIRVSGTSMINAGISTGDILVVDNEVQAVNGNIVVAAINDELLVKRIKFCDDGSKLLISENDTFPPIHVSSDDKFNIWGVVSNVIKSF